MWEYKEEDLLKGILDGNFIDKSGCYVGIIKSLELSKTNNGADQIVFDFETVDGEVKVYYAYTKTTGEELTFKTKHLNHLLYLCKLKDPNKIKECIGKNIGIFLKAKLSYNKEFINFDIEGFYHPTQNKTATELSKNTKAEEVEKMLSKYAKEIPLERIKKDNVNVEKGKVETIEDSEDSFPF